MHSVQLERQYYCTYPNPRGCCKFVRPYTGTDVRSFCFFSTPIRSYVCPVPHQHIIIIIVYYVITTTTETPSEKFSLRFSFFFPVVLFFFIYNFHCSLLEKANNQTTDHPLAKNLFSLSLFLSLSCGYSPRIPLHNPPPPFPPIKVKTENKNQQKESCESILRLVIMVSF